MVDGWSCPLPLRDHPRVTLAHGGGGLLTSELVDHLFIPAFGGAAAEANGLDSAVLDLGEGRLAFTTDSFVVHPLFFPGGCIGDLAINGTVNDLAMVGAVPLALSTAFVLEEGLDLEVLGLVATAMGHAATIADVELVAGDTKVVELGRADGMYITTSGVGFIPDGVELGPTQVESGDVVIVSGPIGRHGVAVMSLREGLEFETTIESDCAPLAGLVAAMLEVGGVRCLRDATRGGLAGVLYEIATDAGLGVEFDAEVVPVPPQVRGACEMLGLDALHVANEGVLVGVVEADRAEAVLEVMRSRPEGAEASSIGEMVERRPGMVIARTALGSTYVVDRPLGEQLPRIC